MTYAGPIDRSGSQPDDEFDRERRILELLSQALELDGDERRAFLDEACAGDRELRDELEAMLEDEPTDNDGFLETPAAAGLSGDPVGPEPSKPPVAAAGSRFGPYRVVETLGQGGMGTVYLADQRKPVRRRVALKVLDSVHDRRRLKRFAAEGQALARLNHPNVAALYEASATTIGQPFVAMEWIEGVAITDWCDQRRLSLEDRIKLFLDVCAGVQHAHEKGILHRDLKPANVLVTKVDGRATAKVIDFGIARALGEPLLDTSSLSLTLENQVVGSPVYMCPEAAAGESDLDTRSDVYALGLLLYHLMIGELPLDIRDINLVELLRRIAKGGWPTLSARFAELDPERRSKRARLRGLSERQLTLRLRGDLDAIAAKTVARDPKDRYGSPAELAADLRRHLDLEPVTARPATTVYVLGRFLRRRAGTVLVTAALVLALAVGAVASILGARRASQEVRRANQQTDRANLEAERAREALAEARSVSHFLIDLFELADPERSPGEPIDVRQLLDRGALKLEDELGDQPLARALFLHTIGEVYTKMALFEQAAELVGEAMKIRERELPAGHPDVLESVNQLGVAYRRLGRLDEAEPLLRRVLAARESAPEPDMVAVALALNNLGNLLWSRERYDEAEALHWQALAIRERELGSGHADLAETLTNLGALFHAQKRNREAEPMLRRAIGIYAETLGTEHPRYAAALHNLSLVLDRLERWAEAEENGRRAAEIWEAAYGAEHPRTRRARAHLAGLERRNE